HLTPARMVAFWILSLLGSLLSGNRSLLFAWLFVMVGVLPVIFIPQRGLYALYLVLPGFYLFIATGLTLARRLVFRHYLAPAALFLLVAAMLTPLHLRQKPKGNDWVPEMLQSIHPVMDSVYDVAGPIPQNSRVLFLEDPYSKDDWIL